MNVSQMKGHVRGGEGPDMGTNTIKGQAMIEFVVALVVIMVILAGLVHIAALTHAHTQTMLTARHEAAQLSMADTFRGSLDTPYIFDWIEGPDGKPYTRDDFTFPGTTGIYSAPDILEAANPDEVPVPLPSDVLAMLTSGNAADEFFLVKGYDFRSISNSPLIQRLFYNRPNVTVESEVWLTWTEGLY